MVIRICEFEYQLRSIDCREFRTYTALDPNTLTPSELEFPARRVASAWPGALDLLKATPKNKTSR